MSSEAARARDVKKAESPGHGYTESVLTWQNNGSQCYGLDYDTGLCLNFTQVCEEQFRLTST